MPKAKQLESALHDWVLELPFQMQALLMTCMRGPDGLPKHAAPKCIIRYLRGLICKPAGDWHGENNNDFMWGDYNWFTTHATQFWSDHDEYPHHFIMHLVHCSEVIGYMHPMEDMRVAWLTFYLNACESFHMRPETKRDMEKRLNDFGCGIHSVEKINLES